MLETVLTSTTSPAQSFAQYEAMYARSLAQPNEFWDEQAKKFISWISPYDQVMQGSLAHGDVAWFVNGKLNVSANCLDRHLASKADKTAIIWEGDEPTDVRHVTYGELFREVCRLASALKSLGVRKGDCVAIYMPMVPEAAYAMLACARIGAPHSVVFGGFSADALRDRIQDASCSVVITGDQGMRGGKSVPLKRTVDEALHECPTVKHVVVFKRTGATVPMTAGRDVYWDELCALARPYCVPEALDSEDYLFYLYTSGSTGKPKGLAHTQGGYLLWATMTHRYVFDLREDDVYACVADVGWVTGHSYIVYGPLANGATTLMFESTPLYPNAGRYWDMVQRHKINVLYTAPTAVRALMKFGLEPVQRHDLSSLRVLGSVGEPINPEAWRWLYNHVGGGRCSLVDTYWQTETGGHMLTPLAGVTPTKPGSATLPFFGVEPVLVDASSGVPISKNDVEGVLTIGRPWPGMARTVFGDHRRYLATYMTAYPGLYFTGDGVIRDQSGYYWITGRVDDVLNVSGHRLGTAEIESAIITHEAAAEAAAVGCPHDIKGQAIFVYVVLKHGFENTAERMAELKNAVRLHVGSFAKPDYLVAVEGLPKTRSGKIMRRILRKIACGEIDSLGDVSTLAEPAVVDQLIAAAKAALAAGESK